MNGSDKMHMCESLCLNFVCWMEGDLRRFCHVAHDEETREMLASDLDVTLWMSFVSFNLNYYNSLDERLRLNCCKMICRRTRMRSITLHLSDD